MNKLEYFKPEVIDGSLWLITPLIDTRTLHHPPCKYDVRVQLGENGEDHSIEARVVIVTRGTDKVWVETVRDQKTVRCTTLAAMEKEAAKLKEWGANWKNQKMIKGWNDYMERGRKEGWVKSL